MILGNEQAVHLVHEFFEALRVGKTVFPFLLLTWRSHVGKTTCIEQEIKALLGTYMSTDYVAVYDCSEQLGKDHTIKIEVARGEEYLTIDEKTYCQRWMRELTQRLALAPLWSRKVVYLENIERMTTAAANALLKSFEEPLPWRLIIASTSNPDLLLDTIRSRALLIPFGLVSSEIVAEHLSRLYPDLSVEKRSFVHAFSLWAWWLIETLLHSSESDERVDQFKALTTWFARPTMIHEQLVRLQRVAERWQLHQLIDALLYAWIGNADLLVRVKKRLETNVGQDNILFWWCMESQKL